MLVIWAVLRRIALRRKKRKCIYICNIFLYLNGLLLFNEEAVRCKLRAGKRMTQSMLHILGPLVRWRFMCWKRRLSKLSNRGTLTGEKRNKTPSIRTTASTDQISVCLVKHSFKCHNSESTVSELARFAPTKVCALQLQSAERGSWKQKQLESTLLTAIWLSGSPICPSFWRVVVRQNAVLWNFDFLSLTRF